MDRDAVRDHLTDFVCIPEDEYDQILDSVEEAQAMVVERFGTMRALTLVILVRTALRMDIAISSDKAQW